MLTQQTIQYFDQMDGSINDKSMILSHAHGPKVLDAGCGNGSLMKRLKSSGFDAYGIDSSLLALEQIQNNDLEEKFIHGDLIDMDSYFQAEEFDSVIFSSVLHEVYSYNGFSKGALFDVLTSAYKIIKSGGRIIIRDGVKPMGHSRRIIRFKDVNDVLFLKEFCRRFKGRSIRYTEIEHLTYSMPEADAMEFLYTYTWGWDSFDREVQEQYGVFNLVEYCKEVSDMLPGCKIKFSQSYLQYGYEDNLRDKVDYLKPNYEQTILPDSNMLIVIEKEG